MLRLVELGSVKWWKKALCVCLICAHRLARLMPLIPCLFPTESMFPLTRILTLPGLMLGTLVQTMKWPGLLPTLMRGVYRSAMMSSRLFLVVLRSPLKIRPSLPRTRRVDDTGRQWMTATGPLSPCGVLRVGRFSSDGVVMVPKG